MSMYPAVSSNLPLIIPSWPSFTERESDASWFSGPFAAASRLSRDFLCLSFNTWCPEPTPLFDYAWGRVLFAMLVLSNIFVSILMLSVVGGLLMRLRNASWWLSRTWSDADSAGTRFAAIQQAGLSHASLTVLVPAYLPNEQAILDETVSHILEKLAYDAPFTVLVCYNTPVPLPYEQTLRALEGATHAHGRTVRVLKVEGSTSKAQNLNAALQLVHTDLVAIYDADHHPDPHSLLIASAHMYAKDVSCVQGSTYLRECSSLLAHYINAEFFVTHFVFFPAMEFVASTGIFGGSNALWRTADLKSYEFRADVQTEDIELSTRAALSGKVRISFCPECRSGELPPATFLALYKQRLRWALGWDQVTLYHTSAIWSASVSTTQKLGLYYLLPLRWALLFSATLNALITPLAITAFQVLSPGAPLGGPIDFATLLPFCAYLVVVSAAIVNALVYEPPKAWPAIIVFGMTGMLYIGWQLLLVVVSLSKICRGADGGWEVTKRKIAASAARRRSRDAGLPEHGGGALANGANGASGANGAGSAPSRFGESEPASVAAPSAALAQFSPLAAAFIPLQGSRSFPQLDDDDATGASAAGRECSVRELL